MRSMATPSLFVQHRNSLTGSLTGATTATTEPKITTPVSPTEGTGTEAVGDRLEALCHSISKVCGG